MGAQGLAKGRRVIDTSLYLLNDSTSGKLKQACGTWLTEPGTQLGARESPDPSYKDYVDYVVKSATPKTDTQKKSSCGAWAVVSECSSGLHHFAKKLVCGKEWCEVCGKDNSAAHKRRQARILPKLQQVRQLGYFVIEFPEIYRHIGQAGIDPDLDGAEHAQGWCYSKADLAGIDIKVTNERGRVVNRHIPGTSDKIVQVLAGKRCGRRGRVGGYFKRGLARWHWFGDDLPGKWNPHFNVLVDGGHLEPDLLETIKAELRAALNVPDLIVHYSYFHRPGQIVQKARYVTRATFRNYDWNQYMANELYNFRNMRWWGNWRGEAAWQLADAAAEGEDVAGLEAVASLQTGICPDCGQPLKVLYHNHKTGKPVQWSRPVDSFYLNMWQAEQIAGTDYYRIPHKEWQGYKFSPGELLKLEEMEAKATDEPSVFPEAVSTREFLKRRQDNESLWRDWPSGSVASGLLG